jgi:lysozyme family protein
MPKTPIVPPAIDAIIRYTIQHHEGGYVRNPADPGGETKFGISKRSYPKLNIAALTLEQAVGVYYQDWWLKKLSFLPQLPSENIAAKIFDIGINVGERQVVRLCQRALKACGIRVSDDGIAGQMTITALCNVEEDAFLENFRQECADFYQKLAQTRPSLQRFLKGWLNRAYA